MKNLILLLSTIFIFISCSSEKTDSIGETITFIYNHDDKPQMPTYDFRAVFNDQTDISGANFEIGGFRKLAEFDVVHSTDAEWAYLVLAHFQQKSSMRNETYNLKYWKIIESFSTDFNSCVDTTNNFYGRKKFILTRNKALGKLFSKDSIVLGISSFNDYNEDYSTDFELIHKSHYPGWAGGTNKICTGKDDHPLQVLGANSGEVETGIYTQNSLFLIYWDCDSDIPFEEFLENDLKKYINNYQIDCEHLNNGKKAETKVVMDRTIPESSITLTIR